MAAPAAACAAYQACVPVVSMASAIGPFWVNSIEQARAIAYKMIGPDWETGSCGEYSVAEYGFEDETAWLLIDGGSKLVYRRRLLLRAGRPGGAPSSIRGPGRSSS